MCEQQAAFSSEINSIDLCSLGYPDTVNNRYVWSSFDPAVEFAAISSYAATFDLVMSVNTIDYATGLSSLNAANFGVELVFT